MAVSTIPQPQSQQTHADGMTHVGGWLFKRRTIIPLPLALAVLLIPGPATLNRGVVAAGVFLVALGEAIRLWGVRHIGAISRTRSDRLGPLIASGPFSIARNPLYVGNILLWVGFALSAGLLWLAPLIAVMLAFEYHAIVRWEEQLLHDRLGDRYRAYVAQVPRWLPFPSRRGTRRLAGGVSPLNPTDLTGNVFSWGETIYSERGTLIAIGLGFALLWIKSGL
jgi:protein-S-isoprenylcysteine O-methyltransferase Ste14